MKVVLIVLLIFFVGGISFSCLRYPHKFFCNEVFADTKPPTQKNAKFLVIRGFFDEKNNINVYPLYTVTDTRAGSPDNRGPYTVELKDASSGTLLTSYVFGTSTMSIIKDEGCEEKDSGMFYFGIPFDDRAQKLVIKKGSKILWNVARSASAPIVSVKTPAEGATISGDINIEGTARDADGDALYCFVEYSMDGGLNWEPISSLFSEQNEIWKWKLDTTMWQSSRDVMIGISCTDGFNTTRSVTRIVVTPKD